jgi:hypothetical protein
MSNSKNLTLVKFNSETIFDGELAMLGEKVTIIDDIVESNDDKPLELVSKVIYVTKWLKRDIKELNEKYHNKLFPKEA